MSFKQKWLCKFAAVSVCLLLILPSGSAYAFYGDESVTAETPRQSAQAVATTVSAQIKARTAPSIGSGVGANAGDSEWSDGLWADISYSDYQFDGTDQRGGKDKNQTDLWVGMVGIDRTINKLLLGLAFGFEQNDTDFSSNLYTSTVKGDGYTFAPYIAFSALDWLVLDAMYSHTQTSNDFGVSGMPLWGSETYDSTRETFAANVNFYFESGSLLLNPYVGYLHSHNEQDSIDARRPGTIPIWASEITAWFGQWRVGLNAMYAFTDQLEGVCGLAYLQESKFGGSPSNPHRDDDEGEGTLGLNYYINDAFTVGASGAAGFGRKGTDTWRYAFNFSYAF